MIISVAAVLVFSSPLAFATNIGTNITTNDLTVSGVLKIVVGAINNAVLTSDASGNSSWITPAALKTNLGLSATDSPTFAGLTLNWPSISFQT